MSDSKYNVIKSDVIKSFDCIHNMRFAWENNTPFYQSCWVLNGYYLHKQPFNA